MINIWLIAWTHSKLFPQVIIRDACGTWHGSCTVTIVRSIQKSTRNSQKLGKKLVRSVRKKDVQIQKLIAAPWEAIYKLLLTNICHQKMYTPTFCWSMIWWWSSYVSTELPSTNKLVSTNQRLNKSYSRSSFTRSL